MPVGSIEEVIAELTKIIDDCQLRNSRLGYFPAMYRKVTMRVKEGIRQGRFEDGQRMERLDVVFANRYLEAFQRHRAGKQPTRSWAYTFEMAEEGHPVVVQHLLLGMNAHINLDLGIAAAEVCRGQALDNLKNDFFAINEVLAGLLDEVQGDLNQSSPVFRALDHLGWRADEAFGNFSIRRARRAAWVKAQELNRLPGADWAEQIEAYDREVTRFGQILCPPHGISRAFIEAIGARESQEPSQIIEELRH